MCGVGILVWGPEKRDIENIGSNGRREELKFRQILEFEGKPLLYKRDCRCRADKEGQRGKARACHQ